MESDIRLNQRQQERFERLFAEAEAAVSSFDNSEHAERLLIDTLHKLEVWMRKTFGTPLKEDRDGREEVIVCAAGKPAASIASLLTAAQANVNRLLRATHSPEEVARQMHIVHQQVEGVLLPPGNGQTNHGDGSGIEPPRVEPRLQWLVAALPRVGVFTDDLIMTTGAVRDQMMRKVSYALLEIPKIRKEVLVCNQVGEATFVSARMLGMAAYQRHTKEELEALPGVMRIVCRSQDQWTEEVLALLQSQKVPTKINVRDVQAMRREILTIIPTAQEWVAMKHKAKLKFCASGKGLCAIASIFDVKGNPISVHKFHLQLGAQIYGNDDPVICEVLERAYWTLDQWRAEVKKHVPDAETWIGMTMEMKKNMRIAGKGLSALANTFGIKRSPFDNICVFNQLGAAIYGADDPVIQEEMERASWGLDTWRTAVKQQVPDAESWVGMTRKMRCDLRVAGKGIGALARIFGVAGNPFSVNRDYWQLGAQIYGSDDPVIRPSIEEQSWTLDQWREEVKKLVPDAKSWIVMTVKERFQFYVGFRHTGITRLAKIFGINDIPSKRSVHLQLGAAIYGVDDPVIQNAIKLQQAKEEYRSMMEQDDVE